MTLRRLVLWRHGETDYNAGRRMQGQLDSTLTDLGVEQAAAAAPVLARFAPDVLLSSDLKRALDTVTQLAAATGLDVGVDERLRETHLGRWQGLTHDDVDTQWPGARVTWRSDPCWSPPGGENRLQVAARAAAVVDELDASGAEVAIVCSHGGLIASLVGRLLRLPVETWPTLSGVGNCCWAVLDRPAPGARSLTDGRPSALDGVTAPNPDMGEGGVEAPADIVPPWRLGAYNAGVTHVPS